MGAIGYFTTLVFGMVISQSLIVPETHGLLYPFESETREVRNLDGIWTFLREDAKARGEGIRDKWFTKSLNSLGRTIPMPVPASFNDITTDPALRDHWGTVWYEKTFYIPQSWHKDKLIWLRFGGVHYTARVWVNGEGNFTHHIGHLPFEHEISAHLKFGSENRVTVAVDNVLNNVTIPQGSTTTVGGNKRQAYTFDFFNYAGIDRSVHLYTTPKIHIADVWINTELADDGSTGVLNYNITASGIKVDPKMTFEVTIFDRNDTKVASTVSLVESGKNRLNVPNVSLWWPYLMDPEPGYMYQLEIRLHSGSEKNVDVYRMKFGFRTLEWTKTEFLINGKPIYFHGFGRHEDSDIRGKGFDWPLVARDFNLLKWIGANAYRTSHYPYSEESMQFADENGIMIIVECPMVNADHFSEQLKQHHISSINQMIHRDRNHPSAVMWSIANEPVSASKGGIDYFMDVANYTKLLDATRPITASISEEYASDHVAQFLDIISVNKYFAWYRGAGQLEDIIPKLTATIDCWKLYKRPVLISEYGAEAMIGLHTLPTFIWSEEYQVELLSLHFAAFDKMRAEGAFIGEFIWNFADFMTKEEINRVGGNRKGIFTRNRQPKSSAFLVRRRYYALAQELNPNISMPTDLDVYVIDRNNIKDEL